MANYDLIYPGQTIDQLLTTAYYLKNAGYIFLGSASSYSGTPSQRAWLIAPSGFTGFGFSEAIPIGSMGICLYNGTSWSGVTINVVTVDETMTAGSDNPISSGAVYDTLSTITQGISAQLDSLELTDATAHSDILDVLTVALKMTRGGFNVVVSSLDILSATASKAGLMSAADKIKLDGFLNNIRSMVFADTTPSSDLGTKIVESLKWTVDNVQEVITTLTLLAASTEKAGLMSAADKAYVDGLPTTLGNLTSALQDMLASILSIVFDDTTPSSDKANKIVETMKWTSGGIQRAITTLTILAASSEKAGLMSAADKAYVDGLPATLTSLSNSISSIETDLLNYYTKAQTYSKTEVDTLLDSKQNVIEDLADIRSGAAAGATAVQPAAMNSAVSTESAHIRASIGYYECSTAAATAAKTVSASGYTLTHGGCIRIKMINANTANNVTLNINSTGAKALYYDGAQASSANTWEAGEVLEVYYDGTQYQCASGGGGKFASGQKVKDVSLLDALDGSENLPKSSAILNYLQPLMIVNTSTDVQYGEVTTGVQIENGKWVTQSPRQIYLIPYTYHEGDYLRIKGGNTNASGSLYAFLTSNDHTVGHDVPFCEPNETEWTQVLPNVQVDVPIPSTCTYLAINKSYNTSNFLPQLLQIVELGLMSYSDVEALVKTVDDKFYTIYQYVSSDFEQGSLSGDNGAAISSTTRLRTKTLDLFHKDDTVTIKCNGQKYCIYYYSTSGVYSNSIGWLSEDATYTIENDCRLRFLVAKSSNSTIVPSDLTMQIEHYSEKFKDIEKEITTLQGQAKETSSFISNLAYTKMFIGSLVQGGVSGSSISSATNRVSSVSFMVVPAISAKVKCVLPAGYKVEFCWGTDATRVTTYDYWYYNGDTYTFPANARYLRICFANTAETTLTAETVQALIDSGDIQLLLQHEDGVVTCNHATEKYAKASMRIYGSSNNTMLLTALPSFLHTSDLHGDAKRCDRFMDYADYLGVDAALISGDMVANNKDSSKKYVDDIAAKHQTITLQCIGNHETMNSASQALQVEMLANCIDRAECVVDPNATYPTYYYKDFADKKIRVISLNIYEGVHSSTTTQYFSQAQCEWFISVLASTPADYGVIVMMHSPETIPPVDADYGLFRQSILNYTITGSLTGKPFQNIIDAFIGKESASITYTSDNTSITVTANFTNLNSGVEFIAFVNGHLHADVVGFIPNTAHRQLNLNIVCGSTAVYGGTSDLPRDGNSVVQDCFNLYVIDRSAGTVRITKIGSNVTDELTERKYLIIPYRDNV